MYIGSRDMPSKGVRAGEFEPQKISLSEFGSGQTSTEAQNVTVNGQLQVTRTLVMSPSVQPPTGVTGELYYDQATNVLAYYNGTRYVNLSDTTGSVTINNISNGGTTVIQGGGGAANTLSGTSGKLVKFTGTGSVGDSIASESGETITIGGNINLLSAVSTPLPELRGFIESDAPNLIDISDESRPLALGVKFRTDVSGFVRGIRFYKTPLNTGTHVGTLWNASGTQLATGTFSSESATGWQELRFTTPVAVSSDTTYIASYHSPTSFYGATSNYFTSGGVNNQSLHLLRDGDDGGNGVYAYGSASSFPTLSANSSNYFVDVIFAPNPPPKQYQINGVQIASSDLGNNGDIAKRSSSQIFSGNNTFRSSVNNASAFSVQSTEGLARLTVSTDTNRVYLGKSIGAETDVTIFVLGKRLNPGDPVGIEGAIYYNQDSRSFRCYRSGIWDNCALPEVDHSFTAYDEFLGNQNTSFATNNFGTLGWQAQAIGANGSISFDPASPTPVADRPGILALQTPASANQGSTLMLGGNNGSMLLAKDNIIKTAVALSSTTQVVRIGLHNQTTGTARPLSGVWWEANTAVSAQWQYCSSDGTTSICTVSATPITANAWVRLELRVLTTGASGGSSFTAGINGTFFDKTGVTIDTTNRVSPALSCYTLTSTAQSCYWDYFQLKGTTSTGR